MANGTDRSALEGQLLDKALKDEQFRRELIANPKGALEKEYGVSLPADLSVHVHEETKHKLHLVIPAAPRADTKLGSAEFGAADCSGWSSAIICVGECTQCGNNDTTCAPGPTEG